MAVSSLPTFALSLSLNSVPQLPLVLSWMDPGLWARRVLGKGMERPLQVLPSGLEGGIPTTDTSELKGALGYYVKKHICLILLFWSILYSTPAGRKVKEKSLSCCIKNIADAKWWLQKTTKQAKKYYGGRGAAWVHVQGRCSGDKITEKEVVGAIPPALLSRAASYFKPVGKRTSPHYLSLGDT